MVNPKLLSRTEQSRPEQNVATLAKVVCRGSNAREVLWPAECS